MGKAKAFFMIVGGGALVVMATSLLGSSPQYATVSSTVGPLEVPALRLDFGKRLAAASCNEIGSPVVNVTQKIKNTVDSGEAGNYWAFDNFSRTIQVWKTSVAGQYCASVKYHGSFDAVAGQTSPGNTGTLTGKEDGTMHGGYSATIDGTLLSSALWKTNGSVGTTDYQCDISGNCPGAVNWVGQYFQPGYSFSYNWWGWIYRAGANNTWVNSVDGNSGDVL